MAFTFTPLFSSSAGNLYTVEDDADGAMLAIDPGVAPRELSVALRHRVSSLDAALVSHHHSDHSRGAPAVMKAGVDVFASEGCLRAVELFGKHRAHVVRARQPFFIPTNAASGRPWRVTPFEQRHDAPEPLGFLVERLARPNLPAGPRLFYACDTAWINSRSRGVEVYALECNYSERLLLSSSAPPEHCERVLKTHLGLERLLKYLALVDLSATREIWLLHLSDQHSDAAAFAQAVAEATGKPTYAAPARSSLAERSAPPLPGA